MKKLIAIAAVIAVASVCSAPAQAYPDRPIKLIVPFPAGGPTDVLARILGERMGAALGQPVIVENIVGASGTIGVDRVAHAAGDGYTLSIGPWNTHVLTGAVYKLNFDLLHDLEPIALLATNDCVIVSKNAVQATDLKQLTAWIKANPEKVSVGMGGMGTGAHITGVLFQQMTGTSFHFVPYRGLGPMMQALVAGQIDLIFDQVSNSLPQIRAGTIRAYAVTGKKRLAAAPDIPTVDEAGLPGFHVSVWHGLWAPKGTPKNIIAALNNSVVVALADPAVRKRLADLGQDIPSLEQQTPQALGAFHKAEIEKWWPIVKAANIKTE